MWTVKVNKQIIHAGRDFKQAYRMAKVFRGTLTYKPHASGNINQHWN